MVMYNNIPMYETKQSRASVKNFVIIEFLSKFLPASSVIMTSRAIGTRPFLLPLDQRAWVRGYDHLYISTRRQLVVALVSTNVA